MHNGGTVGSGGGGGGRRSLRPRLRGALAVRCTRRIVSLRFFCIFRISIYPVANRRTKEEKQGKYTRCFFPREPKTNAVTD